LCRRFGRKRVFLFCILLMSLTGVAQAVAPDYVTFQLLVFVNAVGTSGVYPLAFVCGKLHLLFHLKLAERM
jgi:OCT family organic cation transporter-like MFS transporter 4/5